MTRSAELLVRVLRVALAEFDRISYQIKADPKVIELIKLALKRTELKQTESSNG